MATVSTSTGTYLANIIDPQVLADLIDKKLVDDFKFAGLCEVDNSLVNRAGDTLSLPVYAYIGDATDVAEGTDIPIAQLSETKSDVKVKKAGRGVQITDEAILSGHGDPMGQAVSQLALSINSKQETDILTVLRAIKTAMTHTATGGLTADAIVDAEVLFGEDMDEPKVLLVSPKNYGVLRKSNSWIPASEIGAETVVKGVVGMVQGCEVVPSNRVGDKEAFIVKRGAMRILAKRDVEVESDRDIINKSTVITADKHYVPYMYDESRAVKIAL